MYLCWPFCCCEATICAMACCLSIDEFTCFLKVSCYWTLLPSICTELYCYWNVFLLLGFPSDAYWFTLWPAEEFYITSLRPVFPTFLPAGSGVRVVLMSGCWCGPFWPLWICSDSKFLVVWGWPTLIFILYFELPSVCFSSRYTATLPLIFFEDSFLMSFRLRWLYFSYEDDPDIMNLSLEFFLIFESSDITMPADCSYFDRFMACPSVM